MSDTLAMAAYSLTNNDTTEVLMDAIGLVDSAFLLSTARARQNDLPLEKGKIWRIAGLAVCLCLAAVGLAFGLQAGERGQNYENGGRSASDSKYFLDSSKNDSHRTAEETADLLKTMDPNEVVSARLFINQGTAAGNVYDLIMENDAELLQPLVNSLISDSIQFTKTDRIYQGEDYAFYTVFMLSDNRKITIFVADTDTIRCDGYFFAASEELDFSPVNEIIRHFAFYRTEGGSLLLDSSLNRSGKTASQVESVLNAFPLEDVKAIDVYMNTTTAITQLFTLTREDNAERVSAILGMLFSGSEHYRQTEYGFSKNYNTDTVQNYTGEDYAFYLTFVLSSDEPDLTVFIVDEETLRCESFFYRASQTLDLTPIIDLITE